MASRIPVIYLGIATNDKCTHVALAFHDGHFNLESCIIDLRDGTVMSPIESTPMYLDGNASCRYYGSNHTEIPIEVKYITNEIEKHTQRHKSKILAAGIDSSCSFKNILSHVLWSQHDILPFRFTLNGEIEERADSASRKVIMWFGPDRIPRLSISYRNQVEVDNNCIDMVQIEDYEKSVAKQTWEALKVLSKDITDRNIRVSFFNATPQGGGVALMRHALMRLFSLLNIQATWHVPKPSPAVFRITKNNHNLFQGVAAPEVTLTDANIDLYEHWVKSNCERYWLDGPFKWSDVIVLDDPQVAAYAKYIKNVNPKAKIIYRSHIEIRSDLVMDESKPQYKLWQYLYGYISQADLFISHPMPNFVPDNVPREKVLMMPACTDPLDGLNKDLTNEDSLYWLHSLNRLCFDQMGNRLHFPHRPYLCQIARFDPAKGYTDVLEAYLQFREKIDEILPLTKIPQLLLCGHGSVDDPDSSSIYDQLISIIDSSKFERYRSDVCIVRVPPEDRILNAALREATVSFQLSHREGFEIKVTESLQKGTPIIVYKAGGIPLQLYPNYPFAVEVGDVKAVVGHLVSIFTQGPSALQSLRKEIKDWASKDEFWTVWQAINWLWLFKRVLNPECVKQLNLNSDSKLRLVKSEWTRWLELNHGFKENGWNDVLQ